MESEKEEAVEIFFLPIGYGGGKRINR